MLPAFNGYSSITVPPMTTHALLDIIVTSYIPSTREYRQDEHTNIQSRVHLQQGVPLSYLRAMLAEWFQWAPENS